MACLGVGPVSGNLIHTGKAFTGVEFGEWGRSSLYRDFP